MIPGMTTPVNLTGHIGVPLDRRLGIAVAGAGARGSTYAGLAVSADIVAVAEPRDHHRRVFTARHRDARVFGSWQDMLAAGRIADAVIIATQDADHVAAATAFADAGYDLLLEKPMATSEADCTRIVAAVERQRRCPVTTRHLRTRKKPQPRRNEKAAATRIKGTAADARLWMIGSVALQLQEKSRGEKTSMRGTVNATELRTSF